MEIRFSRHRAEFSHLLMFVAVFKISFHRGVALIYSK